MRLTYAFGAILLILYTGFAFAWTLSPELAKEIAAKQKAVELNPKDPHAYFDLAITYAYSNRVEEGWATLRKVVEVDPKYPPVGLRTYQEKVIKNINDWKLRFRLAFALYFNGFKDEAIKEFENVIKLDPGNVWAYGYIATIYGEQGKIDEGIECTKKALAIDSNVAVMHFLLGQGYYKKGLSWQGFLETLEALRLRALGY